MYWDVTKDDYTAGQWVRLQKPYPVFNVPVGTVCQVVGTTRQQTNGVVTVHTPQQQFMQVLVEDVEQVSAPKSTTLQGQLAKCAFDVIDDTP